MSSTTPPAPSLGTTTPIRSGAPSPEPPSPVPTTKAAVQEETSNPPAKEAKNPWEICLKQANEYVEEEMKVWKDEVEKLLIFAGLFSGVVASFAIEAYHNVKDDPAKNTNLLLVELLRLQSNATHPLPDYTGPNFDPHAPASATAKRVIIYHFLSLILSLSTAMAGILCLQWIREYGRSMSGMPGPRREHLGVHFMRYRGLEKWHVFTILTTLPLLLLLSLLLFFVGILELLFNVDKTAATATAVMAGIMFLFILITTILPGLVPCGKSSQCPYKSPQAWIFYQFVKTVSELAKTLFHRISSIVSRKLKDKVAVEDRKFYIRFWGWSDYDWRVYDDLQGRNAASVSHGLHWLGAMCLQYHEFAEALYQCINDEDIQQSLHHILTQQDERRAVSINRSAESREKQETEDQIGAHRRSLVVSHTLGHLADKIEQGHPSAILLNQRVDLFLEINEGPHPDGDVDFPRVSDAHLRDLISREKRARVLQCILQMFNKDMRCNETYLLVVKGIIRLEYQEPDPNKEAFDNAMVALRGWMDRRENEPNRDSALVKQVGGLWNHISTLKRLLPVQ